MFAQVKLICAQRGLAMIASSILLSEMLISANADLMYIYIYVIVHRRELFHALI